MTGNYETALMLLAIGMITVFLILLLVVVVSKLMIIIINKYFSDFDNDDSRFNKKPDELIGPEQFAGVIAAVEFITEGKGQIGTIKKITK